MFINLDAFVFFSSLDVFLVKYLINANTVSDTHLNIQDTLQSFYETMTNQCYLCEGACDEIDSLKSLFFKYIQQIAAKLQLNFDSLFSMN